MRFWDSSAIVPLLIRQEASRAADRWFADDPSVALWTMSIVEITSAVWRLARDGRVTELEARTAEARGQELAEANHIVVDVDGVKSIARRLLRVHPLRAPDALQLGAALAWAGGRPQDRIMHTLDERLASAARREGFEVP